MGDGRRFLKNTKLKEGDEPEIDRRCLKSTRQERRQRKHAIRRLKRQREMGDWLVGRAVRAHTILWIKFAVLCGCNLCGALKR